MRVVCKECSRDIPAEDVNIDNLVAKCRSCNAVFSFAEELGARGDSPPPEPEARLKVPLPRGITEETMGRSLLLKRRWFTRKVFFLIFFCTFWDGFLVLWYSLAVKEGAPLVMVIFPVFHVAVGAVITYLAAASIVNTTVINVERGTISIRHGPLPWPGNRTIDSSDLEQLYAEKRFHRTKHGGYHTYELSAVLKSGGRIKLLAGLEDPEQALYLEQEIERHLNIQDRRVADEMTR